MTSQVIYIDVPKPLNGYVPLCLDNPVVFFKDICRWKKETAELVNAIFDSGRRDIEKYFTKGWQKHEDGTRHFTPVGGFKVQPYQDSYDLRIGDGHIFARLEWDEACVNWSGIKRLDSEMDVSLFKPSRSLKKIGRLFIIDRIFYHDGAFDTCYRGV